MMKIFVELVIVMLMASQSYSQNVTNALIPDDENSSAAKNCSDPSNQLSPHCIDETLAGQSSLLQIILVALVTGFWIVYLTFFNSRVVGLIITKIANKFMKGIVLDSLI